MNIVIVLKNEVDKRKILISLYFIHTILNFKHIVIHIYTTNKNKWANCPIRPLIF